MPLSTQSVEHGAASADGPAKGMSTRAKFLLALGPFTVLWLLWWRLGDLRLHQKKETGITEWLYSVPRTWTVDWFNFAGRDIGTFKATGWVNVWFNHLRKKELLAFAVNWHLSPAPWVILAVVEGPDRAPGSLAGRLRRRDLAGLVGRPLRRPPP